MSDPDFEKYRNDRPQSQKKQEIPNNPHLQVMDETSSGRGKVKYEIDDEGNLRKVIVGYNINDRLYTISMVVNNYGFGRDHIRLEVKKKSKNPLKNIFCSNLLASSITPIRIPAYEKGCLWSHIQNNEIRYPLDTRYNTLIAAALLDIKGMSREIEAQKKYMAHYEDHVREEERRKNREALEEENKREQAKLAKKNLPKDIINFFANGKKQKN